MKNTLIVNLYAGPGAGKSTGAAYIFCKTQNGTVLTANTCLNTLKTEYGKVISLYCNIVSYM